MKSIQIFKCPSNTQNATLQGTGSTISTSYVCNGTGSTFGANTTDFSSNGFRPMSRTSVTGGAALARFEAAAQTILVGENTGTDTGAEIWSTGNIGTAAANATNVDFTNHLGTTNFLFADGHVKALKPSATIRGAQMWSLNPNTDTPNAALTGAMQAEDARLQ